MQDEDFPEDEQIYTIVDIDGFCVEIRRIIAEELGYSNKNKKILKNTLDNFVTINQVEKLVLEYCLGYNEDEDEIYIDSESYEEICHNISTVMYGSALSKLAADGIIESAWDSEINDMVFWLPDN
jgi:hypothetical protein